jgi:hypothetical protein
VHGIDAAGEVVVRRRLSRGRILAFFETASLFPLRCPWRGSPRPPERRANRLLATGNGSITTTASQA